MPAGDAFGLDGPQGFETEDALRDMRLEQRDIEEELERAAEEQESAGRSLTDALSEHLSAGDPLRVWVGSRSWTGIVVALTNRLVVLELSDNLELTVSLSQLTAARVAQGATRSRGRPLRGSPLGIVALLRDAVRTGEMMELGGPLMEPIRGTVRAVAREHVEVRAADGGEWLLVLDEVGYAIRTREVGDSGGMERNS